jgi:hypothetical protein
MMMVVMDVMALMATDVRRTTTLHGDDGEDAMVTMVHEDDARCVGRVHDDDAGARSHHGA